MQIILFVMDGLKIGGVESALISVFHHIDFQKYNIDLLLLHSMDDLRNEVPKEVNILYLDKVDANRKSIRFTLIWLVYKFFTMICFSEYAKKYSLKMQNLAAEEKGKCILKEAYDKVIAYKHGEAENFVAFSVKAKQKILFYHHGSIIDDELHKRAFPHFQTIVAVSDGVKELLERKYPEHKDKLQVIPNYIDPEYVKNRANEYIVERPKTDIVLCTVGRLSPEKNYQLALDVAIELKNRNTDYIWYFIGEGEEREAIEHIVDEFGLSDRVVLTGALKNPLPYVAICDVYIQTSDVESYGLSIQEALILGKPVVSTRTIGGRLLLREQCSSVLAESDKNSVLDGIEKCLHNTTSTTAASWKSKDENTSILWEEILKDGLRN